MTIDSSTELLAFDDDAVDRDLLARPDTQAVAGCTSFERDVLLAAVGRDHARGLRRKTRAGR